MFTESKLELNINVTDDSFKFLCSIITKDVSWGAVGGRVYFVNKQRNDRAPWTCTNGTPPASHHRRSVGSQCSAQPKFALDLQLAPQLYLKRYFLGVGHSTTPSVTRLAGQATSVVKEATSVQILKVGVRIMKGLFIIFCSFKDMRIVLKGCIITFGKSLFKWGERKISTVTAS